VPQKSGRARRHRSLTRLVPTIIRSGAAPLEGPELVSDLVYRFKADTECFTDLAGSILALDGEFVRAIGDKSGNLSTIPTVLGDGGRPIFRASGINALPSLEYDGINDSFSILGASATPFEVDRLDPFSMFFIVNASANSYGLFTKITGNTGYEMRVLGGRIRVRLASSGFGSIIKDTATTPVTNDVDHVILITYDGSGAASGFNAYIDSTTAESFQAPIFDNLTGTTISAGNFNIGNIATSFINGDMPEHSFHDKEFTAGDISILTDYANTEYGITIS